MKLRTRNAWLTLTEAQGRPWIACWSPETMCLVVSTSNGRRIPRTAYRLTGRQIIDLARAEGAIVGPPVQTEIPMP